MRLLALIISIGIAVLPKLAQAQTDCGMPSVGEDHWQVAAPESVGLTSATLCPMVKWLDDWKQSNIHAVLVVRHGTLVFEHYFSGADEHWGRSVGEVAFGPEIKHDERSVTKSIVALVLGIAIDRGLIKSLGEPVLSFFPDYADLRTPEKDRITLRDLVTMSGGLEWHEDDTPYTSEANSENRMDNAADPYRYALQQAVVARPGQVWNYNSGSTEVIGAVLKKATGKSVDELAGTLLFAPLGSLMWSGPETRGATQSPLALYACGHATSPKSVSSCCSTAPGTARRWCRHRGSRPLRLRRSMSQASLRFSMAIFSGSADRSPTRGRSSGLLRWASAGNVCSSCRR